MGDGYATTLLPNGQAGDLPGRVSRCRCRWRFPPTELSRRRVRCSARASIVINLEFQESIYGDLEPGGAAIAAGPLVAGCGLPGRSRGGYGSQLQPELAHERAGRRHRQRAAEHSLRQNGGATLRWAGFSSSYNALQVKLDRRFSDLTVTTAFTWGKAMSYQTGDDGDLLWLHQRTPQLRARGFRPHLDFHAELRLPVAVGQGQEVAEERTGGPRAGQLAAFRRAFADDRHAVLLSPPAAAASIRRARPRPPTRWRRCRSCTASTPAINGSARPASRSRPESRSASTGRNILSGPGLFATESLAVQELPVHRAGQPRAALRNLQLHQHAAVQQSEQLAHELDVRLCDGDDRQRHRRQRHGRGKSGTVGHQSNVLKSDRPVRRRGRADPP